MLEFSIITISSFVTVLDSCTIHIVESIAEDVDIKKYIPLFSILYGIILGVAGYFMQGIEMGNNIIEAIFIGISAGAAATGINQVDKQLKKEDDG